MADNHVMLRCSHCGTTAKYATPADFKFAVPEYLDGRPFEKDGFSIKNAVMCCPKCGYASFNVSKNILTDTRIIYRDEYEEIIKSDFLPKYINSYIAVGYIYENQKEYYNAAHAYLCAAWGCMDEGKKQESLILLENAAKLLLKHIGSEEFKAHPDLEKIQYAVDVLRQMRQFENAKKLAAYALRRDLPEKLRTIFLLEESLCDSGRLLVTGGSLGAQILDDIVPESIVAMKNKKIFVTHQTRPENVARLQRFYSDNNIRANVLSFIHDMAGAIAGSDLVIGRSGASTVVELQTIGRPAILVPLGINPDQAANASSFAKNGGGFAIEQSKFTTRWLTSTLSDLFDNPLRLEKMAQKAHVPNDAVAKISDVVTK